LFNFAIKTLLKDTQELGGKKTAGLIGDWFSVLKNDFLGVKTSLVLVEVLKEQSPWKVPVQ